MTDWTGHIDVLGFGAFVLMAAGMMLRFIIRRYGRLADDYRDLVENHLRHNTEALVELKNATQELVALLREHNRS